MDAARARILCDPAVGRTPTVGPALQALSDAKARLPLKMRGLGQTSAALLSPIAFYAAYTQHAYAEQGCRTRLLVRSSTTLCRNSSSGCPPSAWSC